MPGLKLKYFIDFLQSRGWKEDHVGRNFISYRPALDLDLSDDFRLELPIRDVETATMPVYLNGVLNTLKQLYPSLKQEDFQILLSNTDTIFSTRILDNDTRDGTIQLNKLSKIYDLEKKILKEAVSFLVTRKSLFGNAQMEADAFIEHSRSLPTAKGSFITKIQLPDLSHSAPQMPAGDQVIDKVFKSIDFIKEEIIETPIDAIDKKYVQSYSDNLNIALLNAINNFYKNAQVNHVDFSFYNNRMEGYLDTSGILNRASHIAAFLRRSKRVIIEETNIIFSGHVVRLNSPDPDADKDSFVIIEIEDEGEKRQVRVSLNSIQYKAALDAHLAKKKVLVEGSAKSGTKQYVIEHPDRFEII